MSLEALENRIRKCNRCGKNHVWLFPSRDGVKGFHGSKEYIFVAPQPHEGPFPASPHDFGLYSNMKNYGFKEAHLTDVVKCRGEKYKELSPNEVDNCIGWFDEEVRIIKPKVIVALGTKAFSALMSKPRFKPVLRLHHYSAQISDAKKEEEFKTLRDFLDSGSYWHRMDIRSLITTEQRKKKERQQKRAKFVESLNKKLREKQIDGKEYRELMKKWERENPVNQEN